MTFTLRRFIRTKSTKNIKSIKSTKRQTSDFLLLECFYVHKNTVFYTQKAQKTQISDYFSLRCFLRTFFIFVRLLSVFVLVKSFGKRKKKKSLKLPQ